MPEHELRALILMVALLASAVLTGAGWPMPSARSARLAALTLSFIINAVTIGFFGPAALRVENHGVNADDPASYRWVRLSRWRTPLVLGPR
jgi:hypothetical protein